MALALALYSILFYCIITSGTVLRAGRWIPLTRRTRYHPFLAPTRLRFRFHFRLQLHRKSTITHHEGNIDRRGTVMRQCAKACRDKGKISLKHAPNEGKRHANVRRLERQHHFKLPKFTRFDQAALGHYAVACITLHLYCSLEL